MRTGSADNKRTGKWSEVSESDWKNAYPTKKLHFSPTQIDLHDPNVNATQLVASTIGQIKDHRFQQIHLRLQCRLCTLRY